MVFRCPSCNSRNIRRSKKRGYFEGLLAAFSIRPFRCDHCDCRFFRRSEKLKSHPGSPASTDPFARLQTPRGTPDASLHK
jgi:hypothetical protein